MNRLFRGKRKDNGEWVEGYFLETENPVYRAFIISSIDIDVHDCGMTILDSRIFEVIPETVGQYICLTDKSVKKIFEGDICKTKFFGKNNRKGQNYFDYDIFKVVYKEGAYLLENHQRQFSTQYIPGMTGAGIEVIGNIHDNPELKG